MHLPPLLQGSDISTSLTASDETALQAPCLTCTPPVDFMQHHVFAPHPYQYLPEIICNPLPHLQVPCGSHTTASSLRPHHC